MQYIIESVFATHSIYTLSPVNTIILCPAREKQVLIVLYMYRLIIST
jgi:hypothetical protein